MAPQPNAGVSAPLGIISATNQSGLIIILTAMALCFVLVSFGIRIQVRSSNGPWKTDDSIVAVATVCPGNTSVCRAPFDTLQLLSFVQFAVVFYEVTKGLGKVDSLVDHHDRVTMQKVRGVNKWTKEAPSDLDRPILPVTSST